MSKLQGLRFLQQQFTFQANTLQHALLYKNIDPAKRSHYTLGVGMWRLNAKECQDIAWNLELLRDICEQGDTPPNDYDPYYDSIHDVELDPAEHDPVLYDPYHEMKAYLHPANTPHGLNLLLSQGTVSAAEILLQGPRKQHELEDESGQRPMQRNADDPTGPFRPMTEAERKRYTREQETVLLEATLFLLDFNDEMEHLGELVLRRAPFADILALIGPLPEPEEEPLPF